MFNTDLPGTLVWPKAFVQNLQQCKQSTDSVLADTLTIETIEQ